MAAADGNVLESFVTVGTPLPSLATAKGDLNEFKPIWEQQVVDEKGRRRFHGAFTGGFSAGYFNSVGSKEGWTPSTFKSSRNDRAAKPTTAQLAEQFMDEEDLAELQSSRNLTTAAAYQAPPSSDYDPLLGNFLAPSAAPSSSNSAPHAGAAASLASLIQPAASRIGAQLMRKMGWREGQGVGPRITLKQRRKQAAELGIKLDDDDDDAGDVDDDDEANRHYYAPLDRPLITVSEVGVASDRGWGLGYRPSPSLASAASSRDSRRDMAYGGARMTGDHDDEDDVYESEIDVSTSTRPSKGLDVVDIDNENRDGVTLLGSEPRPGRPLHDRPRGPPALKASTSFFHDGTRVLSGFALVHDSPHRPSDVQAPLSPPRGWKPNPSKVWDENAVKPDLKGKGKGKQLEASERGVLLGEPAPPPVPKSVFDYLSTRDKERLASLSGRSRPGVTPSSSPSPFSTTHPVAEPDATLVIPPLDKATALAALKGFQPFGPTSTAPDPVRQGRYTLYLQLQAGLLPPSNATLPFGPRTFPTSTAPQTISELNRELDDYMRAARVFKPVSGLLAGRFTSGGAGGPAPVVEPGLYQPTPSERGSNAAANATAGEPKLVEHLTPAQNAARAGMFGPLTRTVDSFRPVRLLCKRFGVKDPWDSDEGPREPAGGGGGGVGGAWKEATRTGYGQPADRRTGEAVGKSAMDALMQSAGFRQFQSEEATSALSRPAGETEWTAPTDVTGGSVGVGAHSNERAKKEVPTLETVGLGDDDDQGNETLTYTKAPKDIFAAIFADSDDDEDDDEDEDDGDAGGSEAPLRAAAPATEAVTAAAVVKVPTLEPEPDIPLSVENVAAYRPTFTPTVVRATPTATMVPLEGDDSKSKSKSKSSEKKKKEHKSKKSRKMATLSFDVEDGEDMRVSSKTKDKVRKRKHDGEDEGGDSGNKEARKRRDGDGEGEEEEVEWVEKAPEPRPVAHTVPDVSSGTQDSGPGRTGRPRAMDLYE